MSKGTNELAGITNFTDTDTVIVDSNSENVTGRLTGADLKTYIKSPSSSLKRYGYRVKVSTANASSRVEYLYDAVGLTPSTCTGGIVSLNGWADKWFITENKPCVVIPGSDGPEIAYWLNPNNYGLKADGSASDAGYFNGSPGSLTGNVMAAIPTVWYKRWYEGGYRYFVCCEEQYDDTYYADVHQRSDGDIGDYKMVAAFEGTLVSGKIRSLGGMANTSLVNTVTYDTALSYAKANGSEEWIMSEFGVHELIADLLTLISKSTNGKACFGRGRVTKANGTTLGTAISDCIGTGSNSLSNSYQMTGFFGYPSSNIQPMRVFHIENWWANQWKWMMGCIQSGGYMYTKMNSYGGEYNLAASGYRRSPMAMSTASSSMITTTWCDRYGMVPLAGDTSVSNPWLSGYSTYECDGYWIDTSQLTVARRSGGCTNGLHCGPRCLAVNSPASGSGWNGGASLSLRNPLRGS